MSSKSTRGARKAHRISQRRAVPQVIICGDCVYRATGGRCKLDNSRNHAFNAKACDRVVVVKV